MIVTIRKFFTIFIFYLLSFAFVFAAPPAPAANAPRPAPKPSVRTDVFLPGVTLEAKTSIPVRSGLSRMPEGTTGRIIRIDGPAKNSRIFPPKNFAKVRADFMKSIVTDLQLTYKGNPADLSKDPQARLRAILESNRIYLNDNAKELNILIVNRAGEMVTVKPTQYKALFEKLFKNTPSEMMGGTLKGFTDSLRKMRDQYRKDWDVKASRARNPNEAIGWEAQDLLVDLNNRMRAGEKINEADSAIPPLVAALESEGYALFLDEGKVMVASERSGAIEFLTLPDFIDFGFPKPDFF